VSDMERYEKALLVIAFTLFSIGTLTFLQVIPFSERDPVIPEANGQGEFSCDGLAPPSNRIGLILCNLPDGREITCMVTRGGISCDWP
jgi:hypothetical protein